MVDIVALLSSLGFRSSPEQIRAALTELSKSRASPAQTLERFAEMEMRERKQRNLMARTLRAALGTPKPIVDFDWEYATRIDKSAYDDISTLGFHQRRQNVLFRGPSGTGKTMLAKNIGLLALEAGLSVVFTSLSAALADLLRQESLPAVERRIKRYTSPDILILDELGYQPIDPRSVDLLFQVISRRHESSSTIITTNLCFKDWATVFPGAACLVPLVDRFTENLITFDIQGESYRQRSKSPVEGLPPKRTQRRKG